MSITGVGIGGVLPDLVSTITTEILPEVPDGALVPPKSTAAS